MFNLVKDPWIPVRYGNELNEVSLSVLFQNCQSISDICCARPPQQMHIFRLLLAIAHAAIGEMVTVDSQLKLWTDGHLGGVCGEYLEKNIERFNLFGENAILQRVVNTEPAHIKILEDYRGDNTGTLWHPLAYTDCSYAETARALIALRASDTSGRKKGNGKNGASQGSCNNCLMVFPKFSCLEKSIIANLIVNQPLGMPDWIEPTDVYQPTVLSLLTFPEREIQLFDNGSCVSEIAMRVRSNVRSPSAIDPHVPMVLGNDKRPRPVSLVLAHATWENSEALLHSSEQGDRSRPKVLDSVGALAYEGDLNLYPFLLEINGYIVDQGNPVLWKTDRLKLPKSILDGDRWPEVEMCLNWAFKLISELKKKWEHPVLNAVRLGNTQQISASIGQEFPWLLQHIGSAEDDKLTAILDYWKRFLIDRGSKTFSVSINSLSDWEHVATQSTELSKRLARLK